MKKMFLALVCLLTLTLSACSIPQDSSDTTQRKQQEAILAEATASVGMPAIKNFRERRILKDILELRDQDGIVTTTYTFSEVTGELKFFCTSIGYGIPYATQFTNPEKIAERSQTYGTITLPQADPNGLFSPSSADGTWVLCKDPNSDKTLPVFVEPKVVVSPFELQQR